MLCDRTLLFGPFQVPRGIDIIINCECNKYPKLFNERMSILGKFFLVAAQKGYITHFAEESINFQEIIY